MTEFEKTEQGISTQQGFPATPSWFAGVFFPLPKAQLLEQVGKNSPGAEVMQNLQGITDRYYFSIDDVLEELDNL